MSPAVAVETEVVERDRPDGQAGYVLEVEPMVSKAFHLRAFLEFVLLQRICRLSSNYHLRKVIFNGDLMP